VPFPCQYGSVGARRLLTLLAALALLAAVAPGQAAARSRSIKVALPSAGDLTLAHVVFKRSVARSRRLPRFRLVSRRARRLLRRHGVVVLGGSIRLSRRRVVGSVLMLRRRPRRGRILIPPRGAAALLAANADVESVVVERNAIADLRRENARAAGQRAGAAGEEANAPTACGETGLFSLVQDHPNPTGAWSFGIYYNDWDRLVDFDPPPPRNGEDDTLMRLGYGIACGLPDRFENSPLERWLDDLLFDLGAPSIVPFTIITTFVGSAVDSQGNVLTQPSFQVQIRVGVEVDGVLLGVEDRAVNYGEDSAGNDAVIQNGMALFPFVVPPGQDRAYTIRTDPPLMRGDEYILVIDTEQGNARVEDVM
jgi:hypothetical protein